MKSFIICLVLLPIIQQANPYLTQKLVINAHSALVTSVRVSPDSTFFISGSQDHLVKVWDTNYNSATNSYPLLHTQTYGDTIQNANIHPTNNKIFVTTWLSDISVLDPTSFLQLNPGGSGAYPNTGYANSIIFKSDGSLFYMGGFDTGLNPIIHKYDALTYVDLGSPITTTFPVNGQIVFMDIMNDLYMVTVSNAVAAPFLTQIWDLSGGTLLKSFSDSQDEVTSVNYQPNRDQFYISSKDSTIRSYGKSVFNNQFEQISVEYTGSFGIPYSMSTQYQGYLYAAIGLYVVQYTLNSKGRLTFSSKYNLPSDGFSLDIQYPYLLVGCNGGEVKVFLLPQSTSVSNNISDLVVIGIVLGSLLFIVLVIAIVYKLCCYDQEKQKQKQNADKNGKSKRINNTNRIIHKKNKETELVDITQDDLFPQGYR